MLDLLGSEGADLVGLIGTNIRFAAPVFNARNREADLLNNLRVASIGQCVDLRYHVDYLGDSASVNERL